MCSLSPVCAIEQFSPSLSPRHVLALPDNMSGAPGTAASSSSNPSEEHLDLGSDPAAHAQFAAALERAKEAARVAAELRALPARELALVSRKQILSCAREHVLPLLVYHLFHEGAYVRHVEALNTADLRAVLAHLGLPWPAAASNKVRKVAQKVLTDAIEHFAAENPDLFESDPDSLPDGHALFPRLQLPSASSSGGDAGAVAEEPSDSEEEDDDDRGPPMGSPPRMRKSSRLAKALARVKVGAARQSPPLRARSPSPRLRADSKSTSSARRRSGKEAEREKERKRKKKKKAARHSRRERSSSSDSPSSSSDSDDPTPPSSARSSTASASSSSSSESDSEMPTGGGPSSRAHGYEHLRERRMARDFILNVLSSTGGQGKLFLVFKYDVPFNHERNRREVLALAQAIDLLRVNLVKEAIELLARRLAGVHTADLSGDWAYCDQLEQSGHQSFLPDSVLRRVTKSVRRMEALQKKEKKSAFGGRGGGAAVNPRWNDRRPPHSGPSASSAAPSSSSSGGAGPKAGAAARK